MNHASGVIIIIFLKKATAITCLTNFFVASKGLQMLWNANA